MTRNGAAVRLAAYYALLFAAVGIHLPFWPLWLADSGMSAAQIGVLGAAAYLARALVNPLVGAVADRRGDRRRPMLMLMAAATLAWTLFAAVDGFPAILAVTIVASGLWAGVMPVGESLALMAAGHWHIDYGRLRLWGSAAFILAAIGTGHLLLHARPWVLVWLIALCLAATAMVCAGLPDLRAPAATVRPAAWRPLLTSRPFLLFLACAGLNLAAHTVYYSFATLHWRAAGIADDAIGLLWSEGVVAEIVLFAASGWVVRRLGPGGLLLAAGIGGILRWLALASTTWLPALAVAQVLHAATFGCGHLGAMHFLSRAVPPGLGVRAQGLFATVAAGLLPGLTSLFTGWLYQRLGGGAFVAMAGLSLGSALAGRALLTCWHGGKVVEG